MIDTPGWRVLTRHVFKRQISEQKAIIQGRCDDFQDYKSRVSFTDGMEFVTSLPEKTIELMETLVKQKIEREPE